MKGNIIKYAQDNIDTDVIIPGRYLKVHDYAELATHAMEGLDPDFHSKVKEGDCILSGRNFGCGSSREHAPIALSHSGIKAVLALSLQGFFIEMQLMVHFCYQSKLMKMHMMEFQKAMK